MFLLESDYRIWRRTKKEKEEKKMAGTRLMIGSRSSSMSSSSFVVWLMAAHLLVTSAMEQLDTGKNYHLKLRSFLWSTDC